LQVATAWMWRKCTARVTFDEHRNVIVLKIKKKKTSFDPVTRYECLKIIDKFIA